jgi:hypothetical protein
MNIAASLAQSHVSQNESAKSQDAQRNKQATDARQLSRLAEQQQDEVETTEEAEHLRVHREGEGAEGGGRQPKEQEQEDHEEDSPEVPILYNAKGATNDSGEAKPDPAGPGHIDLSV